MKRDCRLAGDMAVHINEAPVVRRHCIDADVATDDDDDDDV